LPNTTDYELPLIDQDVADLAPEAVMAVACTSPTSLEFSASNRPDWTVHYLDGDGGLVARDHSTVSRGTC
jgi:hypothetical protein